MGLIASSEGRYPVLMERNLLAGKIAIDHLSTGYPLFFWSKKMFISVARSSSREPMPRFGSWRSVQIDCFGRHGDLAMTERVNYTTLHAESAG